MKKAQFWASSFTTVSIFDSNAYTDKYSAFSMAIAVGEHAHYKNHDKNNLQKLQSFLNKNEGKFIVGYLGYDLIKNNTSFKDIKEKSEKELDLNTLPVVYFYVPEVLIKVKDKAVHISSYNRNPTNVYNEISNLKVSKINFLFKGQVKPRLSREEYSIAFKKTQEHILRGDVYELNLCQEFYAENVEINPFDAYQKLNQLSPNPFSCFFKAGSHSILSASPERFLGKRGNTIFSQPIKGTSARGRTAEEDIKNMQQLKANSKDVRENIMIVDLVRNDLTKVAKKASVKVDELLGLYTFPQVHQLISTISCTLDSQKNFSDIIVNTFPPGSMTGAPKEKAIELIEELEKTNRGVYSGAIGYITPTGDFDFNVIIRSIIYNAKSKYLSYHVGGAITALSNEKEEYEECLIKASAIKKCLE